MLKEHFFSGHRGETDKMTERFPGERAREMSLGAQETGSCNHRKQEILSGAWSLELVTERGGTEEAMGIWREYAIVKSQQIQERQFWDFF